MMMPIALLVAVVFVTQVLGIGCPTSILVVSIVALPILAGLNFISEKWL